MRILLAAIWLAWSVLSSTPLPICAVEPVIEERPDGTVWGLKVDCSPLTPVDRKF